MIYDANKSLHQQTAFNGRAKDFHRMGKRQWTYKKELAEHCGFQIEKAVIENLYEYTRVQRNEDLANYRKTAYRLINDKNFERIA